MTSLIYSHGTVNFLNVLFPVTEVGTKGGWGWGGGGLPHRQQVSVGATSGKYRYHGGKNGQLSGHRGGYKGGMGVGGEYYHIDSKCLWEQHQENIDTMVAKMDNYRVTEVGTNM